MFNPNFLKMTKEVDYQKPIKDLFELISAKDIGQHLAETISAYIKLDIESKEIEPNGKYFSDKVYVQISLINFFYELEKQFEKSKLKY